MVTVGLKNYLEMVREIVTKLKFRNLTFSFQFSIMKIVLEVEEV